MREPVAAQRLAPHPRLDLHPASRQLHDHGGLGAAALGSHRLDGGAELGEVPIVEILEHTCVAELFVLLRRQHDPLGQRAIRPGLLAGALLELAHVALEVVLAEELLQLPRLELERAEHAGQEAAVLAEQELQVLGLDLLEPAVEVMLAEEAIEIALADGPAVVAGVEGPEPLDDLPAVAPQLRDQPLEHLTSLAGLELGEGTARRLAGDVPAEFRDAGGAARARGGGRFLLRLLPPGPLCLEGLRLGAGPAQGRRRALRLLLPGGLLRCGGGLLASGEEFLEHAELARQLAERCGVLEAELVRRLLQIASGPRHRLADPGPLLIRARGEGALLSLRRLLILFHLRRCHRRSEACEDGAGAACLCGCFGGDRLVGARFLEAGCLRSGQTADQIDHRMGRERPGRGLALADAENRPVLVGREPGEGLADLFGRGGPVGAPAEVGEGDGDGGGDLGRVAEEHGARKIRAKGGGVKPFPAGFPLTSDSAGVSSHMELITVFIFAA